MPSGDELMINPPRWRCIGSRRLSMHFPGAVFRRAGAMW
jgi:hypothetical protein